MSALAPKSVWWIVASLVLMVVGAFGPWADVAGFTINGTDEGGDGWLVFGAAVVAAVLLLVYTRRRRTWLLAVVLLAALAGIATTAYDIVDINNVASEDAVLGSLVNTSWGIYVALVGSISLALATVALVVQGRRGPTPPPETPTTQV